MHLPLFDLLGDTELPLLLFDSPLKIARDDISLLHARNEQRSVGEQVVHLLERALGGFGKEGPEEDGVGEVAHNEEEVPSPGDGTHGDRGGLTDHGVESERGHGCNGHTLGTSASVEDLSGNDPR